MAWSLQILFKWITLFSALFLDINQQLVPIPASRVPGDSGKAMCCRRGVGSCSLEERPWGEGGGEELTFIEILLCSR